MSKLPASFFQDLARPPVCADPHPAFEELRGVSKPQLATGEIVLVNHADAVAALRDARFHKPILPMPPGPGRILAKMFLLMDGPDHQRLRRTMAPLFSPSAVASRVDEIDNEANRILSGVNVLDAASDFADVLPLSLTGRWLGLDPSDLAVVRIATRASMKALDAPLPTSPRHTLLYIKAVAARDIKPISSTRAVSALVRLAKATVERAEQGTIAPGAMFLEELAAARQRGDIDREEAIATWVLMVIAGYETTSNLIATSLHHVLSRPDLLEIVRADTTRLADAVEETLRFDGPFPITARVASENIELPSCTVGAGETVMVALSAANRDPAVFDEPNSFIIDRDHSKHIGFGHGVHLCSGARLARAETRSALAAVIERGAVSDGLAQWRQGFGSRGIVTLPVRLANGSSSE